MLRTTVCTGRLAGIQPPVNHAARIVRACLKAAGGSGVGIAVFYRYEGPTAERLEAESELRDTAAALQDALDEYERSLVLPAGGSASLAVRGAELRIEFAQRRVGRAAVRARDLIARERLAGSTR